MDSLKNSNEVSIQGNNEEEDDDPVELPPDTLAILQEFLHNKDLQKSLEPEDMFEENWVKSTFTHQINISAYQLFLNFCFLATESILVRRTNKASFVAFMLKIGFQKTKINRNGKCQSSIALMSIDLQIN